MVAGRKPGPQAKPGTRFKPGQSGNPAGRKKLPPEIQAINSLTPEYVKKIISKFSQMSKEEMGTFLRLGPDDPGGPNMMEIMIGSIVAKAAQDGDYTRLNFLLDRSIGRVKETIDVSLAPRINYQTTMEADGRMLQELVKEEIEAETT